MVSRSRSDGNVLVLWNLSDGKTLDAFKLNAKASSTCMSYNNQNTVALGTSTGEIFTFTLDNDQLVHVKTLEPNSAFGPVRVLKFSPNSKILVSGHDVGVLEVRICIFAPKI